METDTVRQLLEQAIRECNAIGINLANRPGPYKPPVYTKTAPGTTTSNVYTPPRHLIGGIPRDKMTEGQYAYTLLKLSCTETELANICSLQPITPYDDITLSDTQIESFVKRLVAYLRVRQRNQKMHGGGAIGNDSSSPRDVGAKYRNDDRHDFDSSYDRGYDYNYNRSYDYGVSDYYSNYGRSYANMYGGSATAYGGNSTGQKSTYGNVSTYSNVSTQDKSAQKTPTAVGIYNRKLKQIKSDLKNGSVEQLTEWVMKNIENENQREIMIKHIIVSKHMGVECKLYELLTTAQRAKLISTN